MDIPDRNATHMHTSYVKDLTIKQINWFMAGVHDLDLDVSGLPRETQNGFYYNLQDTAQPIPNYVQGCPAVFSELVDSIRMDINYTPTECYATVAVGGGRYIVHKGTTAREAAYRCLINLKYGELVYLPPAIVEPAP